MDMIVAHGGGVWGPDEWLYLALPAIVYGLCVLGLIGIGRADEPNRFAWLFRQISDGLRQLTGYPGWAMAGALSGLMALLVAVVGFYWDVAWHIDLGRDAQLFTPSHVMILVGLGGLVYAAGVAVLFASVDRAEVGWRRGALRVPWSALVLGVLGASAVGAFPLDDLWHEAYGIDVTLWSPSHLQLVGGGSLATLAIWLMVAEGRRDAAPRPLGRLVHLVAAGATLVGLTTFQGEFEFGVPQFQVAYLPVLIGAAGALVLVLARIALGRFGALGVAAVYLFLRGAVLLVVSGALNHTVTRSPLYLAMAAAVEIAAVLVSTDRRLRFGLAAGGLAGTVALVAELAWVGAGAPVPSPAASLPLVAVIGPLAALGGAVLGAGLGRAFDGFRSGPGARHDDRVGPVALTLAGVAVLVALLVPLPRRVGEVSAVITLSATTGEATVEVRLDPPDAARRASAFAVTSWQGGGRRTAALEEIAPGRYVSDRPLPVGGDWKTTVGLQRGAEVMAAPVYLPADPEIGAPEIPALPVRQAEFVRNTDLLQREAHPGPAWPSVLAYAGWAASTALWIGLIALAVRRIGGGRPTPPATGLLARAVPGHAARRDDAEGVATVPGAAEPRPLAGSTSSTVPGAGESRRPLAGSTSSTVPGAGESRRPLAGSTSSTVTGAGESRRPLAGSTSSTVPGARVEGAARFHRWPPPQSPSGR